MSTLREDPTTGEWVIVAPRRAARPHDSAHAERPTGPPLDPGCPFCPGNEDQTPPELARTEMEDGWGWDQRVFPNLFPALAVGAPGEPLGEPPFRSRPGVGAHEVVVESPLHNERMDEMAPARIERVLRVWRERSVALKSIPGIEGLIVFKNFGDDAGTSLVHPHSQIMATPVVPPLVRRRLEVATRHHESTGRCVYEDLWEAELREGARVVLDADAHVAVAPFASRSPFEVWILPKEHAASFEHGDEDGLPELAGIIRGVLGALRIAADDPDFNLIVHSAPAHEETKPSFHWHLEIAPRATTAAGFELGSGTSINPVPPEEAARMLREAMAPAQRP